MAPKKGKPKAGTYKQRLNVTKNRLKEKNLKKNGVVKTLCLSMIVRNESKIICRLLDSLKNIIDMISITDTGSTDNTEELILNWGKEHNIPTVVHHQPFINFAKSRTNSLKNSVKSFPNADYYFLSDADFEWEISKTFDKRLMWEDRYNVIQYSDFSQYPNIRILGSKVAWKCYCVTHEYWDHVLGERDFTTATIKGLKIHDHEDGGSKSDKFERDLRLLTGGIKTEQEKLDRLYNSTSDDPSDKYSRNHKLYQKRIDNKEFIIGRYKFYYAQTLKCLKRYKESIAAYQDKIDYKIKNYQETFYSYYMIAECQEKVYWGYRDCIKNMRKMEKYEAQKDEQNMGVEIEDPIKELTEQELDNIKQYNPNNLSIAELKEIKKKQISVVDTAYRAAYENRKKRIEPMYQLARFYKDIWQHKKSFELIMEFNKKMEVDESDLFVEYPCYDYLFDFELSTVGWYVNKDEGRKACLRLIERLDTLPEYVQKKVKMNAKWYN